MVFSRRRKRTLREEVLTSKTKLDLDDKIPKDYDDTENIQNEANIFLSNPASCKGSFLRNKLENPLFGTKKSKEKKKHEKSNLKKVENASDDESEYDDDDNDLELSEENTSDVEDNRIENDDIEINKKSSRKSRILDLSKYARSNRKSDKPERSSKHIKKTKSTKTIKKTKSTKSTKTIKKTKSVKVNNTYSKYFLDTASKTYRRGILGARSRKGKKPGNEYDSERLKRQEKNSSLSSSNSNSEASDSQATSESDVDMLTKYEDRSNDVKKDSGYKLYTENGEPVTVHFNFDYLQINDKICFYEDLASWTNDSKCLRMIYVKNKNTPEQERVEIKLYVVDKEYQDKVTPKDLNELLRKKISILICDKMNLSLKEAMELTKKEATDKEIIKINEQIDMSGEQCLAKSYTKDL